MAMKVKKGDLVQMLSGKDRGKQGRVVDSRPGDGKAAAKALDAAIEELTIIDGQRAQVRRARKSIAQFKIREGMPIGARVTLRGARMYEFLDRLIAIALPRIRA